MACYDYITALEPQAEAKLHLAKLTEREPGQLYGMPAATEIWAQAASLAVLPLLCPLLWCGGCGRLFGFPSFSAGAGR